MDRLEVIYYSAPIPRNAYVLTVLGAVFDKVYFPGVYLPTDGYDQKDLDAEIARIEGLTHPGRPNDMIVGMLRFVQHAKDLKGFCEFTGSRHDFDLDDKMPKDFAEVIYQAIHGPNRPGWRPLIPHYHAKGLSGDGDEAIAYPDIYQYLGLSIITSARSGIPLLNDVPGMPVPGTPETSPHDNAMILSTLLAIECVQTALPNIPLLRPKELMEFREENAQHLRVFRRSMLRYAADLNDQMKGLDRGEIEKKIKFFVQTEISPALEELRDSINAPNRPWYKRLTEGLSVSAQLGLAALTANAGSATDALGKLASTLVSEIEAAHDKNSAAKRAGLFYLLRLQDHRR